MSNSTLYSPISIWSEELKAEGGTGRYFNDYCQWRRIPEMTEFVNKSNAAEIVGKLLQSQVRVQYNHTYCHAKKSKIKYQPLGWNSKPGLWFNCQYKIIKQRIEYKKARMFDMHAHYTLSCNYRKWHSTMSTHWSKMLEQTKRHHGMSIKRIIQSMVIR